MALDFFDLAIREDLAVHQIYQEHLDSVEGMASLLTDSYGWSELSSNLSEDELYVALDTLAESFPSTEPSSLDSFFLDLNSDVSSQSFLQGSCLQFYFDLYGYGSSVDANDLLVSYLSDLESGGSQRYEVYSGESAGDIHFFFESILRQPALVFQGTFLPQYTKGVPSPTTRFNRQRSLNAVCVDIDPAPYSDGSHHPISPDVLDSFLAGCPDDLMPSYICLTGNGVHLWYVFDSPVQVFSRSSRRTRKLNALARGLYRCVELILEGSDSQLDTSCCSLNHGFRAPGSQTKYGDLVRCFCPEDKVFRRSCVNAATLSRTVAGYLGSEFEQGDILLSSDAEWKTRRQITEEHNAWIKEKLNTPATEAQLLMLNDLDSQGLLKKGEAEQLVDIDTLNASELIRKALSRRVDAKQSATTSSYAGWRTKPHSLIAGSTGGVYATVLHSITDVAVGRRYNSLHMLAGVAYMMIQPGVSKVQLKEDLMALLDTPWAQAGTPLTERDIKNALGGYNPNNRQTVNSIITTLGFSPFKPPAKRNGRKQGEHLKLVADGKKDKTRAKIVQALADNPSSNMSQISRVTGLSRPTVKAHWEECKKIIEEFGSQE